MSIIKAFKLGYNYLKYKDDESDPEPVRAIGDIDLSIEKGEFVAILGRNGSGKSTLAKHMNALLMPTSGTIWIDGKDPTEEKDLWKLRKKAGMVFQNPDNQIIAGLVEEDVAFGPKNYGFSREEVEERVAEALKKTHIEHLRDKAVYKLSGGEKKLAAIATILAMEPDIILMDEPSVALDPRNRRYLINLLKEMQTTKIVASHDLDFILDTCERVIVMNDGRIVADGRAKSILLDQKLLEENGLELPLHYQ